MQDDSIVIVISKAKRRATILFTNAATNQRGCFKGSICYSQVRFPKDQSRQSSWSGGCRLWREC